MTPRRDYLFDNPEGSRVFDLGLGPLELALVGASSPEDQAMVQAHFNQCGREPGLAFAASYLHERGFERIARKLMARRAS
jgi:type IV secretion system protein VirB4